MGTKSISKFFGYVLRNSGTPFQQWVLSEIPLQRISIAGTSSISPVLADAVIPITSLTYNSCPIDTSIGGIKLCPGLWKIEYNLFVSTEAAGKVSVSMMNNGVPISTAEGNTSEDDEINTTSLGATKIVKILKGEGPQIFTFANTGPTTITPILRGGTTMEVIITKICG